MKLTTEYDVLGIGVRIITNCEVLHHRLQDMKVCADQDRPFAGKVLIEVPKRNGRYVILEGGETLISCADPEGTTVYIYELVNFHLMRQMRGFVKIHAACASLNGIRFLLAGEKGVGKTTLATRFLFEDISVHGDEKVLVRNREAIPLPRKFHLKEGSVRLIPQISPIWDRKISYPSANGARLCFFDPTDAGFNWQTKWDKVNLIFYVEPNHGKSTEIEGCPKWLMAQKLIMQSLDFDPNPEPHIACLCEMVAQTESFLVRLADLDGAVTAIKGIISKT